MPGDLGRPDPRLWQPYGSKSLEVEKRDFFFPFGFGRWYRRYIYPMRSLRYVSGTKPRPTTEIATTFSRAFTINVHFQLVSMTAPM